eukprot:g2506.t1
MLSFVFRRRQILSNALPCLFNGVSTLSQPLEVTGYLPRTTSLGNIFVPTGWLRSKSGVALAHDSFSESDQESLRPGIKDTASLIQSVSAYEFRQYLEELSNHQSQISYNELLRIARDQGAALTAQESRRLCDGLITSGIFFRYGHIVYLKPSDVVDVIKSALPDSVKRTEEIVMKLNQELEPLQKEKQELEKKTARTSDRILVAGLGFLVIQFFGLMRLTFWDFSWDVIEPAAYFLTLGYGIGFYVYYLLKKEDYQHSSVERTIRRYYYNKAEKYDAAKYEALFKRLSSHRRFLSRYSR